MKPLVYYAGPIKSDPLGNAHKCINDARDIADGLSIDFFVPHLSVFEEIMRPRSYEEWMVYDFNVIRHCDALYRSPGTSEGADREVKFAELEGIPVFYDVVQLNAWKRDTYDKRI